MIAHAFWVLSRGLCHTFEAKLAFFETRFASRCEAPVGRLSRVPWTWQDMPEKCGKLAGLFRYPFTCTGATDPGGRESHVKRGLSRSVSLLNQALVERRQHHRDFGTRRLATMVDANIRRGLITESSILPDVRSQVRDVAISFRRGENNYLTGRV